MHAVFLYHAIPKGLNMSIVNAGALPIFTDIDAELRNLCEEVILNKSADGNHVERFLKLAEATKERLAAEKAGGVFPKSVAVHVKGLIEEELSVGESREVQKLIEDQLRIEEQAVEMLPTCVFAHVTGLIEEELSAGAPLEVQSPIEDQFRVAK